jgi:hypothetical protein
LLCRLLDWGWSLVVVHWRIVVDRLRLRLLVLVRSRRGGRGCGLERGCLQLTDSTGGVLLEVSEEKEGEELFIERRRKKNLILQINRKQNKPKAKPQNEKNKRKNTIQRNKNALLLHTSSHKLLTTVGAPYFFLLEYPTPTSPPRC